MTTMPTTQHTPSRPSSVETRSGSGTAELFDNEHSEHEHTRGRY